MAKKLLLVDDEVNIVMVTKKHLEFRGFEVECAYDGLDALNKVKEFRPDLVLLDLFMPVMHGYEVCKKLKKDPSSKDIPVIFFSAGHHKDNCPQEAKDVGAVDFIAKPFDIDELADKINFYTKKKS
ncbi:PleD family two-component system response regulator [Candidatus Omnitrophota bacterium]